MIRTLFSIVTWVVILSSLTGCGPGKLAPPDYVRWLEDPQNGMKQEVKRGSVSYEVQYKPAAYILANEERSQEIERGKADKRLQELGNMCYFTCTMKSNDGTDVLLSNLIDQQEYYQRVNYLSLEAQQDFNLVSGSDTLPCALYQLENTYGATPYMRMVLAFSGKSLSKEHDLKLIYQDRIFTKQPIEFLFEKNKLNNLPQLLTH